MKKRIKLEAAAPGQSLVEMALLLPILLLLMVGMLDLGRAFYAYITITNAAREGARYAASHPTDDSSSIAAAVAEAASSGYTISSSNVSLNSGHSIQPGDPITVTVSVNYSLLSSYVIKSGSIPLSASTSMAILNGLGD